MYSRNFGGVRSDGQLREFESNWKRQYTQEQFPGKGSEKKQDSGTTYVPVSPVAEKCPKSSSPKRLLDFDLGFLKNLQIDDLILIGIGILLLLDSDGSNDLLIILIAAMLFF